MAKIDITICFYDIKQFLCCCIIHHAHLQGVFFNTHRLIRSLLCALFLCSNNCRLQKRLYAEHTWDNYRVYPTIFHIHAVLFQ